ncbi:MAG: helix-turn-helix domain-containing protein [Rubrivivax sp.]|nr:helix-turn-helix domain-containing protein [Rubrivivax sp.]
MHKLQAPNADALRATLAAAQRCSRDGRFLHRLHAVLLVSLGQSCTDVARWFGEDARSVERWVRTAALEGVDGLRDQLRCGRPARLTPQQSQSLAAELAAAPVLCGYAHGQWSGKLLARHLDARYGVQLSLRGCQRLLHRRHPPALASGPGDSAGLLAFLDSAPARPDLADMAM